jgi:hypothetical protein
MRHELIQLDKFKIISVIQILLSRYAHPIDKVREILAILLAEIALKYPS